MAANSDDDRNAPQRAQQQQPRQQDPGQRASDAAPKTSTPTPRQAQPVRPRYFAPGEDGECH